MAFPSPGHLPDPGIEPKSPALAGEFFTSGLPGEAFSPSRFNFRVCVGGTLPGVFTVVPGLLVGVYSLL